MELFKRLSGFTAFITLLLISLGGFVHNTDSSLACPDWPLCFGQVFPEMKGSVAIEHSHRLLASFVGLLTIGLVWTSAKFRKERKDLYRGSLIALGLVIFQGVLGGITVLLKISPLISTFHLATSQIFFGLLCWLFWKSFNADGRLQASSLPVSTKALRVTALLLYLQMLLGASIRHGGAGVVCGVGSEAALLCLDSVSGQPTWWPTGLAAQAHWIHRLGALVVAFFVFLSCLPLLKLPNENFLGRWMKRLALAGMLFVIVQILLGVMTISTGIGVASVTLHLVFAALLWFVVCSLNFLATMTMPRRTGKPLSQLKESVHA